MMVVGITGGIGSGKSYVCSIYQKMGIPVYNSDKEAKLLMNNSLELRDELTKEFGEIYNKEGLNREKLGAIVFNDKSKLEKLNAIVHPKVGQHFDDWKNAQTSKIIIKEAAILIESGTYKQVDKIGLVTAPLELKIERVQKRDNFTRTQIENRINKQLSDNEKLKYADFVINNNQSQLLLPQLLAIYE